MFTAKGSHVGLGGGGVGGAGAGAGGEVLKMLFPMGNVTSVENSMRNSTVTMLHTLYTKGISKCSAKAAKSHPD